MDKNILGYYVNKAQKEQRGAIVDRTLVKYKKFNIKVPIECDKPPFDYVPQLPSKFSNFKEFFEYAARETYGKDIDYLESLLKHYQQNGVPSAVDVCNIKMLPGWSKYDSKGKFIKQVKAPYERAIVFDVETFVKGGAYPIIATATGKKHSYIWIAKEFIESGFDVDDYDQLKFIPLPGTRVIVGHNVAYDLVRVKEAYDWYNPIKFFDTLSAHIVTNGFASGQRYIEVLRNKAPEKLTVKQRVMLDQAPEWSFHGSTNSLVAVYNYHVAKINSWFGEVEVEEIEPSSKDIRDVFVVTENMEDFVAMGDFRYKLLNYASKDTYYTAKIFESVYPKYKESKPSSLNVAGHFALSEARVPLRTDWFQWIETCERILKEDEDYVTDLLKKECWVIINKWLDNPKLIEKDFFYGQLDWGIKRRKTPKDREGVIPLHPPWIENDKPKTWSHVPNWFFKVWSKPWTRITTKSDISHILLRLHWHGLPLFKTKTKGWVTFPQCKDGKDTTTKYEKIPHKVNPGDNVG